MTGKYIFANDIRPVLESGKLEVELSPGSRLSPSAADLIRDYGARVVYIDPDAKPKQAAPPEPAPEEKAPAQAKPKADEDNSNLRRTIAANLDGEASPEDVEKILERVMARLGRAKGQAFKPGADDDLIICRCEEITKGQIRAAIAAGMGTLNGIKRVSRAGMGLCQGQTCQRLVTQILCAELGLSPAEVEPTTARPPTRPIPLDLLATGSPGS